MGAMKVRATWVRQGRSSAEIEQLAAAYAKRISAHVAFDAGEVRTEATLLEQAARQGATLVLLDSRGRQLSSEQLAEFVRRHQEQGTAQLLFAIGPADGFTEAARSIAAERLSFGPMTFPHELARVMLLEQIYRALTIIKGHPYHLG